MLTRHALLFCLFVIATPALADSLLTGRPASGWSDVNTLIDDFLPADQWQRSEPEQVSDLLQPQLNTTPPSAFPADAYLGPLQKILLLATAGETDDTAQRYHLRYARAELQPEGIQRRIRISMVELHRIEPGSDNWTSWRLMTRALRGHAAIVIAAGSTGGGQGRERPCFNHDCLHPEALIPVLRDWPKPERSDGPTTDSTITMLEQLLVESRVLNKVRDRPPRWEGFEQREGVADGEVFVDVLIERNLQGDSLYDAMINERRLMDHELAAIWRRLILLPAGRGAHTLLFSTLDVDRRMPPP